MAKKDEAAHPTQQDEATAASPISPPIGEGDDDSLILWMLSLTPFQRLEMAQGFMEGLVALRHGRRV